MSTTVAKPQTETPVNSIPEVVVPKKTRKSSMHTFVPGIDAMQDLASGNSEKAAKLDENFLKHVPNIVQDLKAEFSDSIDEDIELSFTEKTVRDEFINIWRFAVDSKYSPTHIHTQVGFACKRLGIEHKSALRGTFELYLLNIIRTFNSLAPEMKFTCSLLKK